MSMDKHIHFIVNHLLEAWNELAQYLLSNPEKLAETQFNYWKGYSDLQENIVFTGIDKRFQYQEWQENGIYFFIKQSYLLMSHHVNLLISQISQDVDDRLSKKLKFYSQQFLDMFSPSNFVNTNPEVVSKIFETQGSSLMHGFQQFLDDLKRGDGRLNLSMSDLSVFELGHNIACTPGKIIYQNDLIQLIQYNPTTEEIYENPLLIIPPWINKFYILDLQPENSFVKWIVSQGITVFMISWVNPDERHRDKQFEDYMIQGIVSALKIINKKTSNKPINTLGYCVGGTLLGCALAYLAKKKSTIPIQSATFLTTLFDFSEPGDLGILIDDKQINDLEKKMQESGYLDGRIMAAVFNMLRSNDLIWSSFINHYLKGQKPKPFDLLYWNADPTHIPEKVHSFYLRNMYLNNNLIKPNKLKLAKTPLDLTQIKIPTYFLAAQDDHIVPWKSAYSSQLCLSSPVKFVLASSGHVAGVINPPIKNKYGYWTHSKLPKKPDLFLESASFQQGSWWTNWFNWLIPHTGNLQSSKILNTKKEKIIEPAPGSYVKTKIE